MEITENHSKRICSITLPIVMFTCLLLCSGCPTEIEIIEMLYDCDVESPAQYWIHSDWPDTVFVFDKSKVEYASPTQSLKISKTNPSATKGGAWWQSFETDLPLNKKLTLSAKIKCVDVVGEGANICIICDSETMLEYQSVHSKDFVTINGNTDWLEYSVHLDAVKPEVTKISACLRYRYNTTGTIYFDDIHLIYEEEE